MKAEDIGLDWLIANDPSHVTPSDKAIVTRSLEAGDRNENFGHLSVGMEGDFKNGEGELVAVVQATQEDNATLAWEPAKRKRRRGRRSGSKRRTQGRRAAGLR